MPPHPGPETGTPPARLRSALLVLWPAFVAAGVLEMLVFAWVDPAGLHGVDPLATGVSHTAVYTLSFLVFWALVAAAIATSRWLERPPR